jgi:lysophospholipase L1-like esterase
VTSRRREWAFRAAALLAACALLELGLRALELPGADACWMPKEDFWLPDDALGFAYRPGDRVSGGTVNALGLRGPVPAREKPAGTLRVLFVGDSSTWGWKLADGETYWFLASRALSTQSGVDVEPIVAAAPGYSSYQSRVLLARLLAYRPDHVVLYVGGYNDHRRRGYYADAEIPARMARRRAAWHALRALRAGELLGDRFGAWLARQRRAPALLARVPPRDFEANLRAMLAAADHAGARALVLVPPFSARLRAQRAALPAYEEILARVPARLGVASVDLGPLFADADPDPFQRDGFHPSAEGQRRIAAAVVAALAAGARP